MARLKPRFFKDLLVNQSPEALDASECCAGWSVRAGVARDPSNRRMPTMVRYPAVMPRVNAETMVISTVAEIMIAFKFVLPIL